MTTKTEDGHELGGQPGAVVHGNCVRWTDEPARVRIPGQSSAEPRVDLIREGNIIRAIEVVCTCGRCIRIRCDYTSKDEG